MQQGVSKVVSFLRNKSVQKWLAVWTLVLLFSAQGFRNLLTFTGFGIVAVLTIAAVAISYPIQLGRLKIPATLMAFLSVATLSVFWSSTRFITAVSVVVLLATTFAAIQIVRNNSQSGFFKILHRALQITLAIGLVFELIVATVIRKPIYPIDSGIANLAEKAGQSYMDAWSDKLLFSGGPVQGFVGNRNPFAALALFAAIVAIIALLEGVVKKRDGFATLGCAALVHLLTLSATIEISICYLLVVAGIAIFIRHRSGNTKRVLSFATLGLLAAVGLASLVAKDKIFAAFQRDPDLTNRVDIWHQVIEMARERPLLGWGHVSYWPVWQEPYQTLYQQNGFRASHAHNAFLDSWLQLGLVGAGLLIGIVGLVFLRSWMAVSRANIKDSYLSLGWLLLIVALGLQSLTESRLLIEGSWFLLVALYLTVPRWSNLRNFDRAWQQADAALGAPEYNRVQR